MKEKLTMAAISEQPLTDEEKKLLRDVYSRFEIFEEQCRPYHETAATCREILRLRDPYQDPPGTEQKTLQLQTLKSTVNNCVADQMENMPEARLLPETPQHEEDAQDLQDAVHYVLYTVNNYERIHRRRAEDLFCTGTSVLQIGWDPALNHGKGDVAVLTWPVEAFLWDPQVSDIQDSRALIKTAWWPLSWYKEHYPDKACFVQAEESSTRHDVGLPAVQKNKHSSDEDRALMLEYWYREFDSRTNRYSINVVYCAGGALLDHRENVYTHGMYPFVVDAHSPIVGAPVGDGLVDELVGMMRYINRYNKYLDTNLRMSSKGRLLTRRNSGIDKKALADWSQDMIEGDSIVQGEDWGWLQHAPFPQTVLNQMMLLESELKQDSGMNQLSRGETTGGIVSGKAIVALQEAGGKISGLRTDTLNNGFRLAVEQVLWLMAQYYDKDRMILITGRDRAKGESRMKTVKPSKMFGKVGKGAVDPPPYTVQIEVNRRNPARVDAINEMYMQAYTMAAQAQQYFPLSALFRLMNIEGKDRLLPVIEENENYMEQMQQMQAQMQQMQGQMEQMQKENQNLRSASTQMANTLASIGAQQGGNGGFMPGSEGQKAAEEGGGDLTNAAVVQQMRDEMIEGKFE